MYNQRKLRLEGGPDAKRLRTESESVADNEQVEDEELDIESGESSDSEGDLDSDAEPEFADLTYDECDDYH